MASIRDVLEVLEKAVSPGLQEDYDNCGLIAGDPDWKVRGIMVSVDVTEAVVEEAARKSCNLLISHHPVIFRPVRRLTSSGQSGKALRAAIKKDIAIYAMHTNLDNSPGGVSADMARRLGLVKARVLRPTATLHKIVTFCPPKHADKVRAALFRAGAGHIGQYDHCSYNAPGYGTFRGDETAKPFVGRKNVEHREAEDRIETIFRKADQDSIIAALVGSHPYEVPAYDIFRLENKDTETGSGIIAETGKAISLSAFLKKLREVFGSPVIKYSPAGSIKIRKVALCGGSGAFLIPDALSAGADIFATADLKYHEFFEGEGRMVLADIGHYESEQYAPELIVRVLKENFPNFAACFSGIRTNPIKYF